MKTGIGVAPFWVQMRLPAPKDELCDAEPASPALCHSLSESEKWADTYASLRLTRSECGPTRACAGQWPRDRTTEGLPGIGPGGRRGRGVERAARQWRLRPGVGRRVCGAPATGSWAPSSRWRPSCRSAPRAGRRAAGGGTPGSELRPRPRAV